MKKYKYDIGLMFVDDYNDFVHKCNKKGEEGWELVQWEPYCCIDPMAKIQPCFDNTRMNILATWRLAYEEKVI